MTFIVQEARVGLKACDTLSHLSLGQAKALRADGFEAIFLYPAIVTAADLDAATGAGLEVGFVMEGLATGTMPTADLGARMAKAAVARLASLGVPTGVTVFIDLEGDGRPHTAWIDFANAAGDALSGLGEIAGGYIGEGLGLTSLELFALRVHRYWKGASRVLDRNGVLAEPTCGWCVVQGFPTDTPHASGLTIDVDVLWRDYASRSVTLIGARPPPLAAA